MDFYRYATNEGEIENPFANKMVDGEWVRNTTSADFLQSNFGHYENLDECIANTESEGLELFFEYLKAQQ